MTLRIAVSACALTKLTHHLCRGGTPRGSSGSSINPPSEIPTQSIWGAGRHHNTAIRNNFQLSASFEDCNCN